MILSDDTKKDGVVTAKGERTKAKEFFEDKSVMPRVRNWLMNATVMLKAGGNKASGVIIDVDSTNAYVLTAKHVLYTLSGATSPGAKKPADFNNKRFLDTVKIGYQPGALESAPAKTAAVTGLDFTGSTDQTWVDDLVAFTSTDADFRAFAAPMGFVDKQHETQYSNLLTVAAGGAGSPALDTKLYEFFQLGYGDGRARAWQVTMGQGYTDYGGKLQCKISTPTAKSPIDNAFEPDPDLDAKDWPRSNQICLLGANLKNSSGPGDSGGPFLSRLKSDKNKVYLVGVTSGANFFTDPNLLKANAVIPADNDVHNNAVTYWKKILDGWKWT